MVFQDHALFPHLNVFENMAFGLMLRKFPRAEIETRVNAAAEMLHLTSLLKRRPTELSGGECQRVALGRALVRQPKIFLLDEPLSNLDAPMRMQLRGEIAALRRQLGATMIFVTHDQAEAMALADRIVVMHDGSVQQIASPTEIYQRPANRFVAGFIGSPPMNFFNGTIAQHNGNVCFEHDEGFSIQIDEDRAKALRNFVGKPMTLGLRPEHIQATGQGNGAGVVNARLERIESTGPESLCYFSHHNLALVSRVETGFRGTVGEAVPLRIETCQAHFFETDSGTRVGV
jgi:multiple sugar transport system ATP-binding protein